MSKIDLVHFDLDEEKFSDFLLRFKAFWICTGIETPDNKDKADTTKRKVASLVSALSPKGLPCSQIYVAPRVHCPKKLRI